MNKKQIIEKFRTIARKHFSDVADRKFIIDHLQILKEDLPELYLKLASRLVQHNYIESYYHALDNIRPDITLETLKINLSMSVDAAAAATGGGLWSVWESIGDRYETYEDLQDSMKERTQDLIDNYDSNMERNKIHRVIAPMGHHMLKFLSSQENLYNNLFVFSQMDYKEKLSESLTSHFKYEEPFIDPKILESNVNFVTENKLKTMRAAYLKMLNEYEDYEPGIADLSSIPIYVSEHLDEENIILDLIDKLTKND